MKHPKRPEITAFEDFETYEAAMERYDRDLYKHHSSIRPHPIGRLSVPYEMVPQFFTIGDLVSVEGWNHPDGTPMVFRVESAYSSPKGNGLQVEQPRPELVTTGWAAESPIKPGDQFTMASVNLENPERA